LRRPHLVLVLALLFSTFWLGATPAAAAPPEQTDRPRPARVAGDGWSLAMLGAWGAASVASLLGEGAASERYGAGLSAGYTFRPGLHAGVVASLRRGDLAGDLARAAEAGVEIGWDVPLGIAVARPLAGAGASFADARPSRASPALWPGVAVLGALPGTRFFAGVDARLVLAFVDRRLAAAPTSFVVAGARL
jgi:hypothetical protein